MSEKQKNLVMLLTYCDQVQEHIMFRVFTRLKVIGMKDT